MSAASQARLLDSLERTADLLEGLARTLRDDLASLRVVSEQQSRTLAEALVTAETLAAELTGAQP